MAGGLRAIGIFLYFCHMANIAKSILILPVLFLASIFMPAGAEEYQQQGFPSELPAPVVRISSGNAGYGRPINIEGMSYNFAPTFFIYPDRTLSYGEAAELVDELGIRQRKNFTYGGIYVINPSGEKYDAGVDFELFKEMAYMASFTGNLKVIGIGEGATFVNGVIAPKACHCIAGILSINGKERKLPKGTYAGVPAYIYGTEAAKAARAYISMAGAAPQDGYFARPGEPLMKVVADNTDGKSLSEVFSDAWKSVLGRNYRFNNNKHTHYDGTPFGEYGTFELEPYLDTESLGIVRFACESTPNNARPSDKWLWYEYWPEELMNGGEEHSIPVVILLHGNTNDPRTQAETSGFLQLAAKERFFVAELEWQGNNAYAAMQHDGIEQVVLGLLRKYPQLDPSRVYAQGLSAGSITATAIGIEKSHIFAAVGGNSGGVFFTERDGMFSTFNSLWAQATQKRGNVITPYCSVIGMSDMIVPFYNKDNYRENGYLNAWNLYMQMAGLEPIRNLDYSKDGLFGIELTDRQTVKVRRESDFTIETGMICKENIPVVKIIAIRDYGHWNFPPATAMMWEFFKHFSRDPQTHELKYN